MVGTGANDSNVDSVLFIPSSKSINHVDSISGVEVVDGAFAIDQPDLSRNKRIGLATSYSRLHVNSGAINIGNSSCGEKEKLGVKFA